MLTLGAIRRGGTIENKIMSDLIFEIVLALLYLSGFFLLGYEIGRRDNDKRDGSNG